MIASGLAMVFVGVWLVLQALGGNLAGRIRSYAQLTQATAAPGTSGTGGPLTSPPSSSANPLGDPGDVNDRPPTGGGGGGGGAW